MDEIDRFVIQLYIDTLANDTKFSDLLEKLSENEGIITPNLKEKYNKRQGDGDTNYTLNRALYSDIQRRGTQAFNVLIQCLKDVHPHLAELLQPDETVIIPPREEEDLNANEPELTEYQGICTVVGRHISPAELSSVKRLCVPIKAKFVFDDINFTQANFHLAIKLDGMFQEEDIKNIGSYYSNNGNLKIIIINIISEIIDNAVVQPATVRSSSCNGGVFIVNIHIHQGDHVPSVINIIREVVANNSGYEIRDIFCVVMEKLSKWRCRLNTESRSFPEFYF